MRTKLTGLIFLLPILFMTITAQTTVISDANFEQFLVDKGYDSNGITGNILNIDAQKVTSLSFDRDDITDFTGLEAFINLTYLYLRKNQFSTLPLNSLTKLEYLITNDNAILTSLDLSKNIALKKLQILRDVFSNTPYDRPISNLDLSANINLEDLKVEKGSKLTHITFPITSTLWKIDLDGLALETIDLSLLDGLEDLAIEYNTGSSNMLMPNAKDQLKRVLIGSIKVPDFDIISEYIALEELSLWYTGIKSLKLPSTETFTKLVIEGFWSNPGHDFTSPQSFHMVPNLKHLQISYAATSPLEIDISKNSKLTLLSLRDNRMVSIDVSQNTELTHLYVNRNDLTSLDISKNTNLFWLNAGQNDLTSIDISKCVVLSRLEAYSNQLSGTDILQQYYTIRKNDGGLKSSNELDLGGNYLSGAIPDFSELVVEGQSTGFELNFSYNKFEFGDFEDQHADYLQMRQNGEFASWGYGYAPQKKVNEIETITKNAGETIILTTTVSGKQNHYKWFKNGVAIPDAPDSPNLVLTSITSSDAGKYHCEVSSDLVPFENNDKPGTGRRNLLLVRNDITLYVSSLDCVTLKSPLNNATDVSIATDLQWNVNSNADGYRLSVGTTAGGTDMVNNVDLGNVNTYNFAEELPEHTIIYVNITPYNASLEGIGCAEESFTTETIIRIPDCTTLSYPINGATDVSIATDLQWNSSNNADGYRLSVGTTAGGSDMVNNADLGNVNTYNFAEELPEHTTIYVNITPYNSAGDAIGCMEESFTTETIIRIPDCTTLSYPINGATDVSIATDLQWNSSNNADGYRLSVGTTAGGSDMVNNADLGNVNTYNFAEELPEYTTIYVNITPYNSTGDAIGCMEESFTTETIIRIPDCTTLSYPINGATDVSIATDLQWNSSNNADGYRLSVGTTAGGSDMMNNADLGNVNTYNFAEELPEHTTIYVNITPYNSAGDAIGCMEESFTTEESSISKTIKYGISPNGDGINDYWEIIGIEAYPDNVVTIYNRWGDRVFEMRGYDNNTNAFRGEGNRSNNLGGGKLPEGTYFYNISISGSDNLNNLQGFIVLKR